MTDDRDDTSDDGWTGEDAARIAEIETLLAELDVDDIEQSPAPRHVWEGIERRLGPAAAPVVEFQHRRRRRVAACVGAAAAAVVVVIGVTMVVTGGGQDDVEVLSTADLSFDPAAFDPLGADSSAGAELISRDGELAIRLTDAELPTLDDEDLELWLIEPDASGVPVDVAPVSLLDDGATYTLPAGLDPDTHFVVDISIEPRDGDAAHSGRSILRGPLEQA